MKLIETHIQISPHPSLELNLTQENSESKCDQVSSNLELGLKICWGVQRQVSLSALNLIVVKSNRRESELILFMEFIVNLPHELN